MTFESGSRGSRQIAAQLEDDDSSSASALALFEEGVRASSRGVRGAVAGGDARCKQLIERADGTFDVVDVRE